MKTDKNRILKNKNTVRKAAQILQGIIFLNLVPSTELKKPAQVSPGVMKLLQFGWIVSVRLNMGKTADLTTGQKIIDTLHRMGKPQKLVAKETGCLHSAVSKYINRKFCW